MRQEGDESDGILEKKENILLDARLTKVIDKRAFHAVLENGHTLVAYLPRNGEQTVNLRVGDTVVLQVSPYDMSRGSIALLHED